MKNNNTPLVDEHLKSLMGMEEAQTDEFFYTRLRARMEGPSDAWRFPLRPVWIVGTLMILLGLNGFMLSKEFMTKTTEQKQENVSIQSFAEAYDQTIHSSY
ncbi:MAG: hypothetical protein IPQ08_10160 [Chitinophagaceae bacterium]|nr:hypothetical protein [Chitinophagaceae bacterium]